MSTPCASFPLRASRRGVLSLLGLGAGAATLAACGAGDGDGGSGAPTVIASCYPTAFLAERVGGAHLSVVNLATPGADAHGLELSVRQVAQLREAALVVQIPGYQAAIDDAIASHGDENVLDVSQAIELLSSSEEHAEHDHDEDDHDGHDHGPTDPHFWHDPVRMAALGDALAARLGELIPEQAEAFTANAGTLRGELEELDQELTNAYGAVRGERPFVTSHAAYAYLADRYDLHQIGISGVDPEVEPSPQRLLELERAIQDEGVTTIFFETTASPKVAQTLADNVGVDSEELDNLETQLSEDADYPRVMRENADKLIASWT
ncbi:metal ABC transporter substrate-binding protein [Brachybacterium sp. p3-SID957]|uniref:metal ABC transporter substrate-binding protein n=1 Tax=Brachybacterium sp. p3-SID957 TaxID=2916049 RepID=UPI00223C1090|nr:metal ABC transporter substrate-binding protein [Brachybacterium sp. p3-SID957]MCT1774761.1 metal ABC transporter substrate-binding protein [Brachybacterium sp. p3-SID957]